MLAQQRLGLGLRDEEDERIPRVDSVNLPKVYSTDRSRTEVKHEARARLTTSNERIAKSDGIEAFQRSRLHAKRP